MRPCEFQVMDAVHLKVSTLSCVMRFKDKVKSSPRYVDISWTSQQTEKVSYKFWLFISSRRFLYTYSQEVLVGSVSYPEPITKRSTRSSSLQRETGEDLRHRKQGVKI